MSKSEAEAEAKCITTENTLGESPPRFITTIGGANEMCGDRPTFVGLLSLGGAATSSSEPDPEYGLGPWQIQHPEGFRDIQVWAYPDTGFVARLVFVTNANTALEIGKRSTDGLQRVFPGPYMPAPGIRRLYQLTYGTSRCNDGRSYLLFIHPKYLDESGKPITPSKYTEEESTSGSETEEEEDEEEQKQTEKNETLTRRGRNGGGGRRGRRGVVVTTSFGPSDETPRMQLGGDGSSKTVSNRSTGILSSGWTYLAVIVAVGLWILWRRQRAKQTQQQRVPSTTTTTTTDTGTTGSGAGGIGGGEETPIRNLRPSWRQQTRRSKSKRSRWSEEEE